MAPVDKAAKAVGRRGFLPYVSGGRIKFVYSDMSTWPKWLYAITPKVNEAEVNPYMNGALQRPHPKVNELLTGIWKFRYFNPFFYFPVSAGMFPMPILPITAAMWFYRMSRQEAPAGRLYRGLEERWEKYWMKYRHEEAQSTRHWKEKPELLDWHPGFAHRNFSHRSQYKVEQDLLWVYWYGWQEGLLLAILYILYLEWFVPKFITGPEDERIHALYANKKKALSEAAEELSDAAAELVESAAPTVAH